MYSGSTLTKMSGSILGAHQKIDRVARKQLDLLLPGLKFPDISDILKFEGVDGPDGIKRKSPGKDEPHHYIDPYDMTDTQLIEQLKHHYSELVQALKGTNDIRAAFEAAWLAHAIVDGLTPAHQYPFEEKLKEMGTDLGSRDSLKKKIIVPGETRGLAVKNNWNYWGPKGLFTAHYMFEWGFATLIAPLSFAERMFPKTLIDKLSSQSLSSWYRNLAQGVARLHIYEDFYSHGWNLKLTRKAKNELAPTLIDAVTAIWYCAYNEAKPRS